METHDIYSNSRYQVTKTTSLESGKEYTFEIIAKDNVDNIASPVTASWIAGNIFPLMIWLRYSLINMQ